MLISALIIIALAIGGMALTYLVTDEETFMWRLAVGNVVGSAIFGLAAFGLALLFGFSAATAAIAIVSLRVHTLAGLTPGTTRGR